MAKPASGMGSALLAAGVGAVVGVVGVLAGTNIAMNASSDDDPPSDVSLETVGYADA